MQSRLGATFSRSARVLCCPSRSEAPSPKLVSTSTGRTADPAIHSGDPDGIDAEAAAKTATAGKSADDKSRKASEPWVPPKPSPRSSSSTLGSTGVNHPLDPTARQKRQSSTGKAPGPQDAICVGMDGTPWPDGGYEENMKEEDDEAYYRHQKASPLSEIEVADTRKPIRQATDGNYGGGQDVVLWREEQLDTADESLRRATEIWRRSATEGDPDSPHGRILRLLRANRC